MAMVLKSQQEQCWMRKYTWLPRSVYMQRVETMKQSRLFNGVGIYVRAEDGEHETVRPVKQYRYCDFLTHWGRVTHICIIGSDNGLSSGRHQVIISTNARILLIVHLRINFSEMLIEIHTISFKKMHLKLSSGILQPFCLGLNVLS